MQTSETDGAAATEARKPRRWFRWCGIIIVVIVAAVLICAVGTATGTLIVPVPGLSLYATLGVGLLLAWLVIAAGRLVGRCGLRSRWRRLLCSAACLLVIVAVVYFGAWRPARRLQDYEFTESLSADELRRLSHRSALMGIGSYAAVEHLLEVGDESSVPYIIWAMGSQAGEASCGCSWHVLPCGRSALRAITNHSPGDTQYAWARWYRDNKHRTPLEWWADGFTAEGYPVSPAGGEKSIRNLLTVLGRTTLYQDEPKWWLTFNAERALRALDADAVLRLSLQVDL